MSVRFFFAELVRVIDGDTVDLRIDTGFGNTHLDRFRLTGIDTPERSAGAAAKAKLEELLTPLAVSAKMGVYVDKPDKYGRWLVSIPLYADAPVGMTVNQKLIELGLARPYDGGHK